MVKLVASAGLLLTLAGSALLFFYGLPTTAFGNVKIIGDMAMSLEGKPGADDDPGSWMPKATAFRKRSVLLNRSGFALIALGTLLQLVAVCLA